MKERLDKIISSQTQLSRKQARISIFKGEVTVDKKVVNDPSAKINPETSSIYLNDKPLDYSRFVYIMMNKPQGVLSVSRDSKAKTAVDIVDEEHWRKDLFPAGRLDKDTTGLLILTDDGDFCHRIISPKSEVYKTYYVETDIEPQNAEEIFGKGIVIDGDEQCLPAFFQKVTPQSDEHHEAGLFASRVKICEGKYHQIKRMFEGIGAKVLYLKRESIGGLMLDEQLLPGECRFLTKQECEDIFIAEENR